MNYRDCDDPRERLLDASLQQLLGAPIAKYVTRPAPRRRTELLAAALVLLGVGVVAFGLWGASAPGNGYAGDARQDPVPAPTVWPEPLRCRTPSDLHEAPADTRNLLVDLPEPARLADLARFTRLGKLTLVTSSAWPREEWGTADQKPREAWGTADQDPLALVPLLELAALEELHLPSDMAVTAEHVRSLAKLPNLHALYLPKSFPATEHTAAAILSLPHLRSLNLYRVTVHDGFLRSLQQRKLQRLDLDACPVPDPTTYRELGELDSVRALAVRCCHGYSKNLPELGEDAFAAFAAMEQLVELDLDETNFPDRFMEQLPRQLRRLRLGDHKMTPGTIRALKQLAGLEVLTFHQGSHCAEAADLIRSSKLRRVRLRGYADEELIATIARHPSLEDVALRIGGRVVLARLRAELVNLAQAPKLRHLYLDCEGPAPPDVLKAFADRQIEVSWNSPKQVW